MSNQASILKVVIDLFIKHNVVNFVSCSVSCICFVKKGIVLKTESFQPLSISRTYLDTSFKNWNKMRLALTLVHWQYKDIFIIKANKLSTMDPIFPWLMY